ncbi:MAG: glycosyltransferase family 2 protein [Candidatus Nanopelagicaceae bacterium]|jgi:glycosyltransferase involved in cell wall biosynthesis
MKSAESDGRAQNGVSVILPVLNEELYLVHAVEAILSQDYLGKLEVILAVGPSTDRTELVAEELGKKDARIVVVENPTGRTAAGLNLAIKASTYPVIVRVDGHAEIPNNYISLAVQILERTGAVNVGGVMAADGRTNFERAVALAMRSSFGVGASRFHTGGSAGPVDTVYLGVFMRDALIAAGGFDERFTRAQDWELNYRLRAAGGVVYFDPRLHVTYRPRPNLKALAKQYYEYGRWRHVVIRRHRGTVNLRYLAPPLALLGTVISILCGFLFSPLWLIPACLYLFFLCLASLLIGQRIADYLRLPWILLTMHMSWGAGYLLSPRSLVPSE